MAKVLGDLEIDGGNVGIGTSNPNANLHVTNSIQVDGGDTFGVDNAGHQIYMSSGGSGLGGEFGTGYARNLIKSDGSSTIEIGDNTSLISLIKLKAGSSATNGVVSFLTKNAERMRVHHDGNVGIGTTSPARKLQIGDGTADDRIRVYFSDNTYTEQTGYGMEFSRPASYIRPLTDNVNNLYVGQSTKTWATLQTDATSHSFNNNGSTLMYIASDGNVGIGTTSPDEKLHIVGDLKVDSDLPRIYLTDSSHNPDYSIVNNNGNFAVFDDTNSAYRIYVNSAGNVGIGTSLPAALLDVNGTAQMSTGITENVHYVGSSIQHWGDSGTGLYFETDELRFYTGGAEEMRLENDGDLHVDGDVIAYSTTVSDERLKDDIQTIDNACEKVCSLRGVEYTWNNGSRKGQREIGVIAQEVEKVIPEIVREKKLSLVDDEVYKTVDYEKLVAVLIEANKELCDRVSKLESKLDGITE